MANKDTAKQWFETGDFPTQTQFEQTLEWLRWKDEKIAFADLTPELQAQITANNSVIEFDDSVSSWTFPAHTLIVRVWCMANVDHTFSMGTTFGGTQIFDNVELPANGVQEGILSNPYYCLNATTIYWTALPANTKFKIYLS